jgi:anti-sigma B factor antagonist
LAPAPFKVRSEQEGDVFVIAVEGELDMNTAPQLESALETSLGDGDAAILIDLSRCEFIDSTGIALLVRAWQGANGDESFALCGVGNQVERVLAITGLKSTIPNHPSRRDALTRLHS